MNEHAACGFRKSHHSEEEKQNLAKRLNRIEGQVRGVKKMIENDTYCDDVLNQITSIRAALAGVETLLLGAHIRSCVKEQLAEGRDEVIDELTLTIKKMLK